jgi:membrane associated rhomboid family serine protease
MIQSGRADEAAPPGPPALARAVALDLVTRYHLRLTDDRDARLGELASDYLLGAAAWTGRRAAFVGFYEPPPDSEAAASDLAGRMERAATWGAARLGVQGAERCDILLVAMGPVSGPELPAQAGPVGVGALAVDPVAATVAVLAPVPPGLPGAGEVRAHVRALRDGREPPTLAAVDLAERQTVAGGYAAPARQAVASGTPATFGLIALIAAWFIAEKLLLSHLRPPGVPSAIDTLSLLSIGALPNSGPLTHDWWRYTTHAFLHDPAGLHVVLNCVALFIVGRLVEQIYGRLVLLGTFVACAAGAGLFWVGCADLGIASAEPLVPGIGASGGIMGLTGLLLMIGRVQGKDVPVGLASSVRQYVITVVVLTFVLGFSVRGVNNYAHLGGFLTGVVLGLALPPLEVLGGRRLGVAQRAVLVAFIAAGAVALGFGAQHISDVLASTPTPVFPGA